MFFNYWTWIVTDTILKWNWFRVSTMWKNFIWKNHKKKPNINLHEIAQHTIDAFEELCKKCIQDNAIDKKVYDS